MLLRRAITKLVALPHRAGAAANIRNGLRTTVIAPPQAVAAAAAFTTTASRCLKQMPPRPKPPPEDEIEEYFLKGSGPGGQKINKTNSAVQLRHKPTGLVVKCQATRSRDQNRKIARELLAQKLDDRINGETSRSAIVGDVKKKRADSAAKKARRKYRKLEEEKAQQNDTAATGNEANEKQEDSATEGSTQPATVAAELHKGP
ncbi:RF-1 domain-containing protein [Diplogelasinospora grovesii]|uniref:RF-1 domain-containing protein n=1 Tax=Diplogelasinospora grovesii TaxID=303347 RepID=A0AAN6NHD6_9PEZI|nr:RF-1 domain-containing protein [Diplogelasinospora grovesii]